MPNSDFDGDGRDDIVWLNVNTGYVSNWLGTDTGGFFVNDANALEAGAPGFFAGSGDFDNDGMDDTLWRTANGEVFLNWSMGDGVYYFQWYAGFVANPGLSWHIAGVGDFDGDELADILWTSDDGRMSNWLSDGDGTFTINDANAMTALGGWHVQGIGNFDGTGSDDILLRNASGALDVRFGNAAGGFATDYSDPIVVPLDWQVAGIGDFDGDGMDDILWRHTNGTISNWLFRGDAAFAEFVVNDANALVFVPLEWQIVGIGDYDGDGHDDILWRNSVTGAVSDWLGTDNGGWLINDANAMRAAPLEWQVQPSPGIGAWDY